MEIYAKFMFSVYNLETLYLMTLRRVSCELFPSTLRAVNGNFVSKYRTSFHQGLIIIFASRETLIQGVRQNDKATSNYVTFADDEKYRRSSCNS